ncbi:MAG: T9SS type A sorting domain-containing protein [Flavobacterium sp.]|nr:T9SS type A sorting domain-containing protein [Flavobacterium sp.]
MKKNYTSLLLLLLLICFSNWSSYGQTPVANNDSYSQIQLGCSPFYLDVLSNDALFGPTYDYIIDLDPNQSGIQSSFSTGTGYFMVESDYVIYQGNPTPFMSFENIGYTVQDLLGNVSNVAVISLIVSPLERDFTTQNTSCEAITGSLTLNNLFLDSDVTIYLYNNNTLVGTYTAPAWSSSYTITGLSEGTYNFNAGLPCGIPVLFQLNSFVISIQNPVTGSVTPAYSDYNSDGIVNVGDIINYPMSVTNTSNTCVMNDVSLASFSGTYINSGSIPSLVAGATDNTSLNFYKVITQSDINNGYVQTYHFISVSNPNISDSSLYTNVPLSTSNGIRLKAFLDINNNGIQEGNEPNYTQGTYSYQINSGPTHNITTWSGEHYLYETNPANIYSISYSINTNNNYCGSQYLVSNATFNNVTVANGSGITTYNFAISVVPCNDVSIYLYSDRNPRPGFIYPNYITYTNEGNQMASGTITFTNDSAVTLISNSVNAPMTATGFTYNYANLAPGQSQTITVYMQVPVIPNVFIGQSVTNSVSISPSDSNPNNNLSNLTRIITGSYDPNDKTESHGGKILLSDFTAEDYFTYTIRFENTGTAEAINIRVNDLLDEQLDETSIKMVRSSHPYELDRMGKNLTWRFHGINLPPSIPGDEVTGHGYIVFQIKPTPGFAIGDIIPNTADIFFDFNPAIVTNTCTTEFVPLLGLNAFASDAFEYYPNPTSDIVTFNLKNTSTTIETIEVMDILGKTLLTKTNNYSNASIDLSSLSKGMYLVKVKAAGQEKTVKISKN